MSRSDNYKNPKEGKTYISARLDSFGKSEQKVRIASKVIESEDSYAFAKVKDEIVLRHKKGAKTNIKAKFIEDNRGIFLLNIQGYTVATEKPHNASFSFIGDEIGKLLEFVQNIQLYRFQSSGSVNISDDKLRQENISEIQARKLIQDNHEVFSEVLKSEITKEDIIAVGYRKKQIEVFRKFLDDEEYFNSIREKLETTNEGLWQKYFEKNRWVFGYGLGYILLSSLDDKKLEQVVHGYDFNTPGKRVDAFLKTRGIISSLCFTEIKTHKTKLLENKPYRSGCWAPSKELAGAVAQVQGTVALAVENLSEKINIEDDKGNPTGEELYKYQPKSYLVIGNLDEFKTEKGVNKDKFRSFELFRKNTNNPEIITFDELFERAKYIVHQNES